MPCFDPMQALFSVLPSGKKEIRFSNVLAELFQKGVKPSVSDSLMIPCGRCIGCRVERKRQWGVRMIHEAKMHEGNSFVTLTFDNESLVKECRLCEGGYSLDRKHMQDFFKRLRRRLDGVQIRNFYCGEYGGKTHRPHYHALIFGYDFPDRKLWKRLDKHNYFISEFLREVWPFGHSVIGGVDFDSASYCAGYCTKKITGEKADSYYLGRVPEFGQPSTKPGLGYKWLEEFGETDCFLFDEVVVNGRKCKPPRYYDKLLEKWDPSRFDATKDARVLKAQSKEADNSFDRLLVKQKCMEAHMARLVRRLEDGH